MFWTTLGSAYIATGTPGGEAHREFLQETVATLRLMGQEAFAASNLGYLAELHAAAGHADRAQEVVAEALDVVRKSGEQVHLPELLRQRAAYTLAGGGDTDEAVADLREAVRVATEQGARVARLRAAIELARLPESLRPRRLAHHARGSESRTCPLRLRAMKQQLPTICSPVDRDRTSRRHPRWRHGVGLPRLGS